MTETKQDIAIYIGRRMNTKNKLSYFWQFDNETSPGGFRKQLVPAQIGEAWKFTRTKEGNILISGELRPVKLEMHVTRGPQPIDQWIASDAVHVQLDAEHRMNAKLAKRKGQFEIALQPLKRLLDALQYHDERAALINKIVSELWRRS